MYGISREGRDNGGGDGIEASEEMKDVEDNAPNKIAKTCEPHTNLTMREQRNHVSSQSPSTDVCIVSNPA